MVAAAESVELKESHPVKYVFTDSVSAAATTMQNGKRVLLFLLLSLSIFHFVSCSESTHANLDQSSAIARILKQKDTISIRQSFHQLFDWTGDLRNKNTSKPFFGSICKNWLTTDAVYEFTDFATFTGCKEIQNKWYNHTRRAYSFLKHHISNDEIEVNGNQAKAYFSALVTASEKKKAKWMQLNYEVDFVKEVSTPSQQSESTDSETSALHEPSEEEVQIVSTNATQAAVEVTEFPNPSGWKIKHLKADFGFVSKFYSSWLETKQPSWSTETNSFVYKEKNEED